MKKVLFLTFIFLFSVNSVFADHHRGPYHHHGHFAPPPPRYHYHHRGHYAPPPPHHHHHHYYHSFDDLYWGAFILGMTPILIDKLIPSRVVVDERITYRNDNYPYQQNYYQDNYRSTYSYDRPYQQNYYRNQYQQNYYQDQYQQNYYQTRRNY